MSFYILIDYINILVKKKIVFYVLRQFDRQVYLTPPSVNRMLVCGSFTWTKEQKPMSLVVLTS